MWARELDLYGNAIAGDSSFIPFLYQGQYYDEEIGLAGNNPNFYGYTFDSNTEVDVWGLDIHHIIPNEIYKEFRSDLKKIEKMGIYKTDLQKQKIKQT